MNTNTEILIIYFVQHIINLKLIFLNTTYSTKGINFLIIKLKFYVKKIINITKLEY